MTNEQTIEQTPKKKNGFLIGCGCFLGAIIIGLCVIGAIIFFAVSSIKSAVKPDLDNFFEKYNNQDVRYICQNLLPSEISEYECRNVINEMYSDLGKEIDYNLSVLKGANINISSKNGKTEKYIKTTGNFEKLEDVELEFKIIVDKSGKATINGFRYHKD